MADFYLDEDVSVALAGLLVQRDHTAATARDLGQLGASDARQLLLAARRGSTLITNNRHDYELLHEAWQLLATEWDIAHGHAGIIVVEQHWQPQHCADEIDRLVRGRVELAKELYRWRHNQWERRS